METSSPYKCDLNSPKAEHVAAAERYLAAFTRGESVAMGEGRFATGEAVLHLAQVHALLADHASPYAVRSEA